MKKLFSILCAMLLLITSISSSVYAEVNRFSKIKFSDFRETINVFDIKIDNLKNKISQINSFDIWKHGKTNFDSVIYDSDGNLKLNLYSVINNEGVIGYMITDINTDVIVEFSLGESPYERYIQRNNEKTALEKSNLKLIRSSGSYFITEDNFKTIKNLQMNGEKRNALNAVNKTLEQRSYDIQPYSELQNITIIKGVPDERNNGTTPGCGPVSGMNLVKYWDTKGYPNLVLSADTKQSLYDELYRNMFSFEVPLTGGQVATHPQDYSTGLSIFFRNNGNYSVNVDIDFLVSTSDFTKLRAEVNSNRPGTILYHLGSEEYGLHYVTFVGYCQDINNENMYIVHDLWSTTPTDIYRNWNYDVSIDDEIWALYIVTPQ